ncbi:MAG: hypothetical protein AABW81_00110 [Nanoarchaeota archaeon]
MVKKEIRTKIRTVQRKTPNLSNDSVEKVLIENFVSLQKVLVGLSGKVDNLTGQISSLLNLFEISAKTLAKRDFEERENKDSKKIVEKIDSLLEQNKIIARGISLLHEFPEKENVENLPQQERLIIQKPLIKVQQAENPWQSREEKYQKSIFSGGNDESVSLYIPKPNSAERGNNQQKRQKEINR